MASLDYDETTTKLERWANSPAALADAQSTTRDLFDIVSQGATAARSKPARFALIERAVEQANDRLRACLEQLPKDYAMALVRRAPEAVLGHGLTLVAAEVSKMAATSDRPTVTMRGENANLQHLAVSPEMLATTTRIIAIANAIQSLLEFGRAIGKGAQISNANGVLGVIYSSELGDAIADYERRRDVDPLADSGFFSLEGEVRSNAAIPWFLSAGPQYIAAPSGGDRRLLFEKMITYRDGRALERLLLPYDDALRDMLGVEAADVLHVLAAFSCLLQQTLLSPDGEPGGLYFEPMDQTETFEHRLAFTFGFCRKGFVRFPEAYLIEKLGSQETAWSTGRAIGLERTLRFFKAFMVGFDGNQSKPGDRDKLSLLLHPSSEGYVYLDLLLLGDFLRGLFEVGKDWFATQHGDRFTLAVKRAMDEVDAGIVVSQKKRLRLPESGQSTDIDLLLHFESTLYAIECKAFAKSDDFLRGAPAAVNQRLGAIRSAVLQAKRSAQALALAVSEGRTEFDSKTAVDWLVCTPTQEFLKPLSVHGMLDGQVPKVLTPRELVSYFTAQATGRAPRLAEVMP